MDNQSDVLKKPFYKKTWFLVTIGLLVVISLLPKGNQSELDKSTPRDTTTSKTPKETQSTKATPSLESRLTKEIESIKTGVDFSSYRGEVVSLQLEIVLFTTWSDMVREGLNSSNPNDVKLANELKRLVSRSQVKELPEIRKNYIEVVSRKLWENNIDVSGGGKGNTTITLTGGTFFSNKNKSEVQETLSSVLKQFRFKRSIYRAYEGQDQYTYYTLESPDDSELYSH